jgi:pimeloyl-ACP methyl ester carboxylesterase
MTIEDPAEQVAALEARGRRVDTRCGDGTMAWRIWGEEHADRTPLVLGHGAQGAWSHWIRNIDVLAERTMVIAADLPGQGDSALPETPDHPGLSKAIAEGLETILGAGRRVDFAGFSFSGIAFAHCAALYPRVARRLILIGCGGLDTPHGHSDIRRATGLHGEERRAVLKANLLGLMLAHPETIDELALHLLVTNGRKARFVKPDLVVPDRLIRVLPEVPVPVDAIWGALDRPHPDPALQESVIRSVQPETDFRVIDGAGHWVMYERPYAFNAALLDMLDKGPRYASRTGGSSSW